MTINGLIQINTAVSFASNTNWQGYGGETTMSYLTQMLGMTVQNFVSAATGMAVSGCAHSRHHASHHKEIGNFWVDMTRSTYSTSFAAFARLLHWRWFRKVWCKLSASIRLHR
jgi:K+-transporting ATPase A subunit